MSTLENAIALAVEAHAGQVDKAGQPYILHPLRVMFSIEDEEGRIVAVLHDVVEDSDTSLDDLLAMGYSREIVDALDQLTRREGEPYEAYVVRASGNPLARQVKRADLLDNMNILRLPVHLGESHLRRLQRYRKAWEIVNGD
jgi:(p)ppGpp synthase/HD superfamily hydrolase